MCEIFVSAATQHYDAKTRSVRLHGVVTSIRLENLFWSVLDEVGARDGMTVVQLIEKLYDELVQAKGEVGNFSSFLRVCALRYMTLQAHGRIPLDLNIPISSLNPREVLQDIEQSPAAAYAVKKNDVYSASSVKRH
jgi:predicted DNA-binding ribbon-helix-helix protein